MHLMFAPLNFCPLKKIVSHTIFAQIYIEISLLTNAFIKARIFFLELLM